MQYLKILTCLSYWVLREQTVEFLFECYLAKLALLRSAILPTMEVSFRANNNNTNTNNSSLKASVFHFHQTDPLCGELLTYCEAPQKMLILLLNSYEKH